MIKMLEEINNEYINEYFTELALANKAEPESEPEPESETEPHIEAPQNNEQAGNKQPGNKQPAKRGKRSGLVGNIFFYGGLVLVVALYLFGTGVDKNRSFLGISAFTIHSESMQSEIPKGSVVLTKFVKPEDIQVGDDITYMIGWDKKMTQRVNKIIENFDGAAYGFETKGVENTLPDEKIIHQDNVVGKVIWHIPGIGHLGRTQTLPETER